MTPKTNQDFLSREYVTQSVIDTNFESWDEIRNKKSFFRFNRNYLLFQVDPDKEDLLPWSSETEI